MNKKLLSAIMAFAMVGSQAVAFADDSGDAGETVLINESFTKDFGEFEPWLSSDSKYPKIAEWSNENNPNGQENTGSVKITTSPSPSLYYVNVYNPSHLLYNWGIQKNISSIVTVGKKYHVSAWIKGGENYGNVKFGACIDTNSDFFGEVPRPSIVVSDYKAVTGTWQKVEFDYEPTNTNNNLLRLNFIGQGAVCDMTNNNYTTLYVDDITFTELPDEPFEFVSSYPLKDTLYNNEAYEIECSAAPSAETSQITVTDSKGETAEAVLSVSDKTLLVNIQNRVQGESYTISGTVKALNGKEFALEAKTYTADDLTHINEKFDGGLERFTNLKNVAELSYDASESRTADGTGSAKLTYAKAHSSISIGFVPNVGFERKITSKFEAGKEYTLSAWVKAGEQGSGSGIKLAVTPTLTDNELIYNSFFPAYGSVMATTEWQKISVSWTPTEDQAKAANEGKYYIRLQRTTKSELTGDKDMAIGDTFYFDDISIAEAADLSCDEIHLTEGQLFYAWDEGYSAVFSLPIDLDKSDITVKDSSGNDVAIEKTTNLTTVNVVIPDSSRKHNAEYAAHFGTIVSISGKTLEMNKDIKFTTNTEFRYAENFNGAASVEGMINGSTDLGKTQISTLKYEANESKTADGSGAAKLTYTTSSVFCQWGGFARQITDKKIIAGNEYLVSAWVKAGAEETNTIGKSLQMAVCGNLALSGIVNPKAYNNVTVSDEWKEVAFTWIPTAEDANNVKNGEIYLRFTLQSNVVGNVFYVDDISIKAIESNKNVTFNNFKASADNKAISEAAELKGKSVNASCTIKNQKATTQNYIVCFAAFDLTTNKMIDVVGAQGTLAVGESKNIAPETALDLIKAENNCTIKVFIWDGLINQSPLSEVQIPLK